MDLSSRQTSFLAVPATEEEIVDGELVQEINKSLVSMRARKAASQQQCRPEIRTNDDSVDTASSTARTKSKRALRDDLGSMEALCPNPKRPQLCTGQAATATPATKNEPTTLRMVKRSTSPDRSTPLRNICTASTDNADGDNDHKRRETSQPDNDVESGERGNAAKTAARQRRKTKQIIQPDTKSPPPAPRGHPCLRCLGAFKH